MRRYRKKLRFFFFFLDRWRFPSPIQLFLLWILTSLGVVIITGHNSRNNDGNHVCALNMCCQVVVVKIKNGRSVDIAYTIIICRNRNKKIRYASTQRILVAQNGKSRKLNLKKIYIKLLLLLVIRRSHQIHILFSRSLIVRNSVA